MSLVPGEPVRRFGPLAFVLTLLAPGLGHLYLGYRGAAVVMSLGLGGAQLLLATGLLALRVAPLTTLALMLLVGGGLLLALAVDAWVRAARGGGRAGSTHWAMYVGFLALALVVSSTVAALRKGYVIDTVRNPSGTMEPTSRVGDHLVVTKWYERGQMPARGDVIVFRSPVDPSELFLKRVVAVGGDTVEETPQRLVVNGVVWPRRPCDAGSPEPTTGSRCMIERAPDGREFTIREELPVAAGKRVQATVPAGQLWVRGDHRGASHDSTAFGPVPVEDVVGRAGAIFLPLDRLGPVE